MRLARAKLARLQPIDHIKRSIDHIGGYSVPNSVVAVISGVALAALSITTSISAVGAPGPAAESQVVDYAADHEANFVAAEFGASLILALEHLTNYATIAIVPGGLEIGLTDYTAVAVNAVNAVAEKDPAWMQVPISYKDVPFSRNDMNATTDLISHDAEALRAQGIDLTTWGPDDATDRVDIRMAKYSDAYAAQLTKMYGPIVKVYPKDFEIEAGTRIHDVPDWYGGDLIDLESGFSCTSWFTVYDRTRDYGTLLTAGHCGIGRVYNDLQFRGTVTASTQKWVDGGVVDAERTDNTGFQDPNVYADPNQYSRRVTSVKTTPFVFGTLLCIDGARELEKCAVAVAEADHTSVYDGKTIYHQVFTQGDDFPCAKGDSGGPVYSEVYSGPRYSGPGGDLNVKAYGMFVAGHFNDNGESDECVFTPVPQVLNAFSDDLVIKTGPPL